MDKCDRKKGKVQIELTLCNQQGCPVAVTVFEGNTSDSQTLKPQLEKLTERFGIKHGIFVLDRGTLPDNQIRDLQENNLSAQVFPCSHQPLT